ncbi:hypothetical protein RJ639_017498 [Escallonia herrerae]|uniref:Sulfotransferase n=1 Tax=Escallonia herrerae TaxID=1293975 RepID=A0AA88VED9_9ASTE|nr:hypothetical protein RJ639_017498 [Escallonia herrerae]
MESTKPNEAEETSDSRIYQKYRETIATLPKAIGGNASQEIYQYQGFWYYPLYLERIMLIQEHFKAQPSHIMVVSMPKCGTTWLKALTFAIATRSQFDFSLSHPLTASSPHECLPFLEAVAATACLNEANNPIALFATHMPFTSLPESFLSSACKMVYICRNPKDALTSMWHFECRLTPKGKKCFTLEEAFEHFSDGVYPYGPYWDHVLGYWKASLEWPEKLLFLKYEDLKTDTMRHVKKLAQFIGHPFSLQEEKDGLVEEVIQLCSFENLSNLDVNKFGKRHVTEKLEIENAVFFRKGVVGDWKNNLTAEMSEQLDKIIEQKLRGSGLSFSS